tara:strand:- start:888 stop:1526 length:639 start_codon:yes stop_codon:yes gene_type:complete
MNEPFAHDRDLLVLEPALLRDVGWAGQRVLDTTGSVAGTTLTLASGSFPDAGLGAGSVALVDGLALEVVAILTPTTATVSLLRARRDGPEVAPPAATNRAVRAYTFGPQRELVHRQVLTMAGIDPDGTGPLDQSAITNPNALVRLEALGALHLIYAGASAPGSGGMALADRAAMYRERFGAERGRVAVLVDLDADGIAEARRSLSIIQWIRA